MTQGLLFSQHFLREGIETTPIWERVDASALGELRERLRTVFERFPVDGNRSEAQTEREAIFPVLEALGWSALIEQVRASRRGRSDVPDILLFPSEDAKRRADAEREDAAKYRHGVAIVENKAWNRPLDRVGGAREDSVPSTQILRYLSIAEVQSERRVQWGFLTNGRLWRLYWQGARSRSEEYLEIDLPAALGLPWAADLLTPRGPAERDRALAIFVLMFSRRSFAEPVSGDRTVHRIALDEGRLWEERVAADLSRVAFHDVFKPLVRTLDRLHPDPVRPRPPAYLAELKDAALVLLYRLLFVLYAEDRELLPVREPRYVDYSLHRVRDAVAASLDEDDGRNLSDGIGRLYADAQRLFRAIGRGEPSIGLPPYNGGLFSPREAPLLDRVELPDAVFARVVDALGRHQKRRINYRDLSVQQLGSIYERLLEYELADAGDTVQVVEDSEGRKQSGSYYTPEELVRLILERTVGPLLDERMAAFDVAAARLEHDRRPKRERLRDLGALDPAERFLDLKVCDPAMGSGHFLVSLVDYLADRVLQAMADAPSHVTWATNGDRYASPLGARIADIRAHILRQAAAGQWSVREEQLDDRRLVRRMILKRAVHGVDKNPMAVELAKVALWLHTFTVGAPLSFLDHHLRCGDSLLGERIRPAADWLERRGAPLFNRLAQQVENATRSMVEIEAITDADIAEVRASAEKYAEIAAATEPLSALLSLIQAERWLGVFDAAPARKPRDIADLVKLKRPKREIDRAERDLIAWNRANAFKGVFDGQLGDPLAVAMGRPDRPLTEPAATLLAEARAIADRHRFLHWELAYPNLWRDWMSAEPQGGFDAVIGNPPYVRQEHIKELKPALKQQYAAYDGSADLYVYFYELALRLLRPGGRLSYVVTNKWLRADYAEPLRRLFGERAWVDLVADFGHAKQFFPDADVFPCVIVARRPDDGAEPSEVELCAVPRDDVRPTDLQAQVSGLSHRAPRVSLALNGWLVLSAPEAALMERIRGAGMPLTEYAGVKPYRGVLTGFNEAFLIDTGARNRLIADDPRAEEIIKPMMRGQDLGRWHSNWPGTWLIFTRRGIDIDQYPSVKQHLLKFKARLEPRPTNWSGGEWKGRKEGNYAWYEIQDSVDYYERFGKTKIFYQEIQYYPAYSLDKMGAFGNNKTYFLETSDRWLLAVLNSPIMWWHNWHWLPHMKDEALSPMGFKMEVLPIARPHGASHGQVNASVDRLVDIHRQVAELRAALVAWYRHEFGIEAASQVLRHPFSLDGEAFVSAVGQSVGRKARLSAAAIQSIAEEHRRSVAPAAALLAEARRHEKTLSDLVNAAYGLTPDEVRLMWETAPPRMPGPFT